MNQTERLRKILELLEEKPKLSQHELVTHFGISKDTARRDSNKLLEQGLVERYPGGISRPLLKPVLETYSNRLIKRVQEKQTIAEMAKAWLQTNMTIFLDVSTTVNFLAEQLEPLGVTVVTNSMDNALSVTKKAGNQAYLLGGFFNATSRLLAGESVLPQLDQFNFDWAFIGGAGMTEQGVMYSELGDVHLKQRVIQNAQKVCLLIDSSKFGQQSAYKIGFAGIDQIITDQPLPPAIKEAVEREGIDVMVVEGETNDND